MFQVEIFSFFQLLMPCIKTIALKTHIMLSASYDMNKVLRIDNIILYKLQYNSS